MSKKQFMNDTVLIIIFTHILHVELNENMFFTHLVFVILHYRTLCYSSHSSWNSKEYNLVYDYVIKCYINFHLILVLLVLVYIMIANTVVSSLVG